MKNVGNRKKAKNNRRGQGAEGFGTAGSGELSVSGADPIGRVL